VYMCKKSTAHIVHLLIPIEEAKLNYCSTINHDNVHASTWYWWL